MTRYRPTALLLAVIVLSGCINSKDKPQADARPGAASEAKADGVAAARAVLSPGDRALVEAQEWCVISTDERLGAMGVPLQLDIMGQPVFVCCKGCRKKAEADPDGTLARVEELKAKAKAERDAKR